MLRHLRLSSARHLVTELDRYRRRRIEGGVNNAGPRANATVSPLSVVNLRFAIVGEPRLHDTTFCFRWPADPLHPPRNAADFGGRTLAARSSPADHRDAASICAVAATGSLLGLALSVPLLRQNREFQTAAFGSPPAGSASRCASPHEHTHSAQANVMVTRSVSKRTMAH
jgi:hypothetical protein